MAKINQHIHPFENATGTTPPKYRLTGRARIVAGMPRTLIAAGIALLLTAGIIAGYGFIDDYLAGHRAQNLLELMREEVPESVQDFPRHTASGPVEAEPYMSDEPAPPEPRYDTIGVLSIPKLALELPVLSECSDSLLKVSICRYEGEALDRPQRLVVAGHDYRSHFGKLPGLVAGDEVRFSNNDGATYSYTVTETANISMYDHEALEQGEWDITLFTCDSDRSRRILIRCRENQYKI